MRTNSRQRSGANLTVWSLALVGFSGLVLWYLGWIPVSFEAPETGTLAENGQGLEGDSFNFPEGDQPFTETFGMKQDFNEADPVAFQSQAEPPVQEGATSDSAFFEPPAQPPQRDKSNPQDPPFVPPNSFAKSTPVAGLNPPTDNRVASRTLPANVPPQVSPFGVGQTGTVSRDPGVVHTSGEFSIAAQVPPEAAAKFAEIDDLIRNERQLAAHRELSSLYWTKPEWRPFLQERIEKTSQTIYFADLPHFMQPYEVQSGDLLQTIGKKYNVPWEYLVRLNRIDPRRIRPGQKLKVIKGPFSARINLSKFELTVHAHGYFVRTFKVGIGKDNRTPNGRFHVINKLVNPKYYGSDGNVIEANDPTNPLGERWIDIGDGFGIHGTINPASIGRAESKGCIRMLNEDVEVVFDLLGVGSEVVIRK